MGPEQDMAAELRAQALEGVYLRSADAIMLLDEGGFIDCNAATVALFGYTDRRDVLNHHPGELSPPQQPDGSDSRLSAEARIRTALAEGSIRFEWLHRRADGTPFPAEVLLTAFEVDGRPTLAAAVRDITWRKQAEQSLRASQANLQLLLDTLPGRVAWIGAGRHLVYFNRQF